MSARRDRTQRALGFDVRTSIKVDRLLQEGRRVTAIADGRAIARSSVVVLTPPTPQLLALLNASDLLPGPELLGLLETVSYNPSLTVMATLDSVLKAISALT